MRQTLTNRYNTISVFLLLVVLLVTGACSDNSGAPIDGDGKPDGDSADGDVDPDDLEDGDFDIDEEMDLPALVKDCKSCHDFTKLAKSLSDESAGPREWLAAQELSGLQAAYPALPAPGEFYAFPWPHRGHHTEANLEGDCSGCHPMDENGLGHSVRSFPETARNDVFMGEADCSSSCHTWLSRPATTQGLPAGATGALVYSGTLDPAQLLQAHETAHTRLWKSGLRPESNELLKIAGFNPGCGGCHHVQEENHGETANCLVCHNFGKGEGALHSGHVSAVADSMAANDPDGPGMSCLYCHPSDDEENPRHVALCYTCHLSGHQPMNADGLPQFWTAK
jgi:hypothetical protein